MPSAEDVGLSYFIRQPVGVVGLITPWNAPVLMVLQKLGASVTAIRAQVESAIVWGLSSALKERVTMVNGVVQQSNFHDYRVLRMNEMPQVEVHIVPGGEVVRDLASLEQHVERDDHRAGLEDAVVDHREVRQVRARQRDLVAGLDAPRDQHVRHLVGEPVHLRVGQAQVAEDDGVSVGVAACAVFEEDGEVQHGSLLRVGWSNR